MTTFRNAFIIAKKFLTTISNFKRLLPLRPTLRSGGSRICHAWPLSETRTTTGFAKMESIFSPPQSTLSATVNLSSSGFLSNWNKIACRTSLDLTAVADHQKAVPPACLTAVGRGDINPAWDPDAGSINRRHLWPPEPKLSYHSKLHRTKSSRAPTSPGWLIDVSRGGGGITTRRGRHD